MTVSTVTEKTDQQFIDKLNRIAQILENPQTAERIKTLALKTINAIPSCLSPSVLSQLGCDLRQITLSKVDSNETKSDRSLSAVPKTLKEFLNNRQINHLFELTALLKKGEMDEAIEILNKLDPNLENSLEALQLPLSVAFNRDITSSDMKGFKKLLRETSKLGVDPVLWLAKTLKLISHLYQNGEWTQKIVTCDSEGNPCMHWLILGFLTKDDASKLLNPNQWAACFSINFPGWLDIDRMENGEIRLTAVQIDQGQSTFLLGTKNIEQRFFVSGLIKLPALNHPPRVSPEELDRINKEVNGEYWKYNLFHPRPESVIVDEISSAVNNPYLKSLFNLLVLLELGAMDKVIGTLNELDPNLENSLDALQLPLSIAFDRKITASDMQGFKKLLLSASNQAEWLKKTLKLILDLKEAGLWNREISSLDASGRPCKRWLIQGFITREDVLKQVDLGHSIFHFDIFSPDMLVFASVRNGKIIGDIVPIEAVVCMDIQI